MTSAVALADLRAAVVALRKAPSAAARRFGRRLDQALLEVRRGVSFEAALGLSPGWLDAPSAVEERAHLLLEVVDRLQLGRASRDAQAAAVAQAAETYARRTWPRRRDQAEPPPGEIGGAGEILARLHQLHADGGPRWPLRRRQIFEVLQRWGSATAGLRVAP